MKGNNNFNKLVNNWIQLLTEKGDFYHSAWEQANKKFHRLDMPGGCPLNDNQYVAIDGDIKAFVQSKSGGTRWDNYIEFTPITPRSKAARIAAKRSLVPNIPEIWFDRSIKTRFGWEIIQWINELSEDDIEQLSGVVLRPRLNKYGELSDPYFQKWSIEVTGHKIRHLSGPRQEAFLRIILGENWKNLFPIR